jgi:uncharacterized protein (DUF58 family)
VTRLVATRRLFHLTVLLGLAGTFALLFNSWIPAAAMVPLAGVLVLAFVEIILPIPARGERRFEGGDRMLSGDEARVQVHLNRAVFPQNLQIEEALPEGLVVKPGSMTAFQTLRGGGAAMEYQLVAQRRGDQRFAVAQLKRVGALGLLERAAPLAVPTRVTVLPPSAKNLGLKVRPRPPQRAGRPTRAQRRGPGDEFYALREYLPGDSIGDINWKATARASRLITNEFLPDEPPRYILYVDTRGSGAELGQTDAFERCLQLAAILVESLIEARAHVGLVLLSYHSVFLVPSGGANQLQRLRQMILDAQPGHEASLHQLVLAGVAHLPSRADAILITPNVYDATLGAAVTFLKARHGHVSVLTPAFPEPRGRDLGEIAERASGALLNAEQAAALAGLRRLADATAQWPPDEPISLTLGRLGMMGRKR